MTNPNALETPYQSAPGHGPSISAVCTPSGLLVGYHPYDHGVRNFQIWRGTELVINTNQPDQTWEFPIETGDDYRIVYAGNHYEISEAACATPQTTTTVSTTTTSVPPTTTSVTPETTTTTAPVTSTTLQEPTTTTLLSNPSSSTSLPLSSTTTESPVSIDPPAVSLTWSTTPVGSLTPVVSIPTTYPTSNGNLPHTGTPVDVLIYTGLALGMIGYALKKKFATRKV